MNLTALGQTLTVVVGIFAIIIVIIKNKNNIAINQVRSDIKFLKQNIASNTKKLKAIEGKINKIVKFLLGKKAGELLNGGEK